MQRNDVPMIGFAAWSGTGKTTLLRKLLPLLRSHGLRVGVVKHAHHDFDIDVPGKDSDELRKAGATHVLVGSRKRWALVVETDLEQEPPLSALLCHIATDELDLILVEGMKHEPIPKIELHRPSVGRPLLCLRDRHIIAVAADAPVVAPGNLPVLDLNNPAAIAKFIIEHFRLHNMARDVTTPSSAAR
ncbi:MAG: molybdopterin-guanine dinucleotide biosynthesis protein MobB [Chromatiales bacterium]